MQICTKMSSQGGEFQSVCFPKRSNVNTMHMNQQQGMRINEECKFHSQQWQENMVRGDGEQNHSPHRSNFEGLITQQ